MDKQAKIYVAGNTGMVGSAIIRNLQKKGYSNFVYTPFPQYDLTNQQTVADFFAKEKPAYVFLAAAKVGGIVANNTYRAEFIYDNLQIQNNIIHHSYVNKVKKLLFLGSSCIYPKNAPQPLKEHYLLTDDLEYTNEPYAIAKIAGIKMCESYNIQYGTNFISVMPTNLYGPNDNFDLEKSHVLPALIRKMHLGKCLMNNDMLAIRQNLGKLPVEGVNSDATDTAIIDILQKYGIKKCHTDVEVHLWGSGAPRREFLHADDLADACVHIMQNVEFSDVKGSAKEIKNTHINIGCGQDQTIKELAEMVKDIVGFKGTLVWDTTKPDGTMQKLLDVSKLHQLQWNQTIALRQGITDVYKATLQ